MDLDDRITIAAPEGVELQLALAGLGSRFIAGATDLIVQFVLILILAIATGVTSGSTSAFAVIFVIGTFAALFLYPILFEVLARGRTPGKRLGHLRVLRDTGAPVDLPASAIRNLMRLIDGPLLLYIPTIVSIAVTARRQRPGDIAAGTIVIREGPAAPGTPPFISRDSRVVSDDGWEVSAVTPAELAAVRRFLERRGTLDAGARRALAARLREGLALKVTGAPADIGDEQFLEMLVSVKARRG